VSECRECGEDAGEGYDLCLNCQDKSNEVIIGKKSIGFYIDKITTKGLLYDVIIIKSIEKYLHKYNYGIRQRMFVWGLDEIRRYKIKEKGMREHDKIMDVFVIKMEKIPSIKGLRTDARRMKMV